MILFCECLTYHDVFSQPFERVVIKDESLLLLNTSKIVLLLCYEMRQTELLYGPEYYD
jgi:hypothetical protein